MRNLPLKSIAVLASLASVIVASACSKKDKGDSKSVSAVKIKPELLRVQASNYAALWQENSTALTALGATKTTNVNIKSLKYPIGGISLSGEPPAGQTASAGGNNAMAVYECAATNNEGCLVELTGEALTNLLATSAPKDATVGTYSQINISPCFKGGVSADMRVKLTAEATLDGVLYYTNAADGLSTTGPAEEVTFSPNGGCGTVKYLTQNIIITKDSFKMQERPVATTAEVSPKTSGELKEQLNLKLYFDLANAIVAIGPSTDPSADKQISLGDFCKGKTSAVNPSVCINFPEIVGTVDSGTPTLTRMLINSQTIWGFYSNSNGIPFGAYQRAYYNGVYSSSTPQDFLIGSMFERFQVNPDDKSVSFQQYDDGQNRHIKVSNFKLEPHKGTMTRGSTTLPYEAVKL